MSVIRSSVAGRRGPEDALSVSRKKPLKNWKPLKSARQGHNGPLLSSPVLSWPAAEGFQHPSGQFPTQTESLVNGHGIGVLSPLSDKRERSTLDERNPEPCTAR